MTNIVYDDKDLHQIYTGIVNRQFDFMSDFWLIIHRLIRLSSWKEKNYPRIMAAAVILIFNMMKQKLGALDSEDYSEFLNILRNYFSGTDEHLKNKDYIFITFDLGSHIVRDKNEVLVSSEIEHILRENIKILNPKDDYDKKVIKRILQILEGNYKFTLKFKDEKIN